MSPARYVRLPGCAFSYNLAIGVREQTRISLIEIGLTAIATVGVLAVLGFILFVAYNYFDGWYILAAIAAEVALVVFIYHLYRWLRYPGLFQSKSSGRLFFEVLFSILFMYSIPLIAILAKFHFSQLLPLDKAGFKLGLEFRFKIRELVQLSADAPFHAGEVGRIARIRVAAENDISPIPFRTGEVIYGVRFADEIVDIPEPCVLHVARVRLKTPFLGSAR